MMTTFLVRLFRESSPGAACALNDAELEAALGEYLARARCAWPALPFAEEGLVRYLAARTRDGALPPAAHAGDLALAFACVQGQPAAVRAFQKTYQGTIARVLRRRTAQRQLGEDAAQIVYERLLVGSAGKPAKLADYRGAGPLHSWVATSAANTVLTLQRAQARRREQPQNDPAGDEPPGRDPDRELAYLGIHYKARLEAAIVRALSRLDHRERTLLRLHLRGMSLEQLAATYLVSRATLARWHAAARRSLAEAAKEELRACLRVSDSEIESIVALVRSQLDVSLARHLDIEPDGPATQAR
jgi:RNA polymerase sigma-70 factor (ECF subfamily)